METSKLSAAAWLELEQTVSRFEEALHDRQSPRIRDYLATREVAPVNVLIELVAAEAEHRWRQGQFASADEYSSTFADLLSEQRDRDQLEATLDDIRKAVFSGGRESPAATATQKTPSQVAASGHLGRYQMIEPISRTSKSTGKPQN